MYFDAQSLANRRLCYCQQSLFEASSYTLVVRTCLRTEDRNVSNNIQRIRSYSLQETYPGNNDTQTRILKNCFCLKYLRERRRRLCSCGVPTKLKAQVYGNLEHGFKQMEMRLGGPIPQGGAGDCVPAGLTQSQYINIEVKSIQLRTIGQCGHACLFQAQECKSFLMLHG